MGAQWGEGDLVVRTAPSRLDDARWFDVTADLYDLQRCDSIGSAAVASLIRSARERTVRIRLYEGSPVARKIERLFTVHLKRDGVDWTVRL